MACSGVSHSPRRAAPSNPPDTVVPSTSEQICSGNASFAVESGDAGLLHHGPCFRKLKFTCTSKYKFRHKHMYTLLDRGKYMEHGRHDSVASRNLARQPAIFPNPIFLFPVGKDDDYNITQTLEGLQDYSSSTYLQWTYLHTHTRISLFRRNKSYTDTRSRTHGCLKCSGDSGVR